MDIYTQGIQRLQGIFICMILKHMICFKLYHLNIRLIIFPYLALTHTNSQLIGRKLNFSLSRLNSPQLALARTISRRVKVPE